MHTIRELHGSTAKSAEAIAWHNDHLLPRHFGSTAYRNAGDIAIYPIDQRAVMVQITLRSPQ